MPRPLLAALLSFLLIPAALAQPKPSDATATSAQGSAATQEKERREAARKALEALKGKKADKPAPDGKPTGR